MKRSTSSTFNVYSGGAESFLSSLTDTTTMPGCSCITIPVTSCRSWAAVPEYQGVWTFGMVSWYAVRIASGSSVSILILQNARHLVWSVKLIVSVKQKNSFPEIEHFRLVYCKRFFACIYNMQDFSEKVKLFKNLFFLQKIRKVLSANLAYCNKKKNQEGKICIKKRCWRLRSRLWYCLRR